MNISDDLTPAEWQRDVAMTTLWRLMQLMVTHEVVFTSDALLIEMCYRMALAGITIEPNGALTWHEAEAKNDKPRPQPTGLRLRRSGRPA